MRRQHNNELNDLYSSPNTIPVIKSRMRWAGNVACIGERRGSYRVQVGKPEGKRPLGDPGIDGRIILKWIFWKWAGEGVCTGLICLRIAIDGQLLKTRHCTFRFHKMWGIS